MGYFGKQVGRPVGINKNPAPPGTLTPENHAAKAYFAAQTGKPLAAQSEVTLDRCPHCHGVLVEDDGLMRCGGRCGRRWVGSGVGRRLDPAALPFGVCSCCRPRLPLVAAEVGATCPGSQAEYLILPEGVMLRSEAAPLGVCRCCLPPQPLVKKPTGLVCRNKPQQHYRLEKGDAKGGAKSEAKSEVVWIGLASVVDQAAVTAAIDAALSANNAELTLFGLFAPPTSGR